MMGDSADGPRPPAARITSLDALRGAALCGIFLINIFAMGGPVAMERPMAPPALGHPDWQIWIIAQLFITGTMRGLFSLLFGAGLLIFVGNDASVERSRLYARRLALLLLFGVIDSTVLLWPGDILVIYALAGLVVLPLHRVKPQWLLLIATIVLLAGSGWAAIEARTIPSTATVYSPRLLAIEGTARLGGYRQTLEYMSYVSWFGTVNLLTWRWVGDTGAMMLIGMALYRLDLLGDGADPRILRRMTIGGYGLGLALRIAHVVLIFGHGGGPSFASALIDQPGRLAMTLGHVGLFQLLWARGAMRRLEVRLAEMGRMALTLYLGQSLMAAVIFSGFGLGLWNRLSWPQLWLIALAMIAVEALIAALWLKTFRFGPLEWIWRWGTYGKRPAMRS